MIIPFIVPAKFVGSWATGEIMRRGAMLMDANTGRIVGHMQETGAIGKLINLAHGVNPLGWVDTGASIYGIQQNEQIIGSLDVLQGMAGTRRGLDCAAVARDGHVWISAVQGVVMAE